MKTDDNGTRIAVQPETEVEQSLLSELFTRLTTISDAPSHPEKVGSSLCYYTLDIPEFDGLDHDLWSEAECDVNEHGRLDPEPGSRALVVVHSREEREERVEEPAEEPTIGDFSPEEGEVAEELIEREEAVSDLDYDDLQEYAKRVGVAANQSKEDLRAIFADLVEAWTTATSDMTEEDREPAEVQA